MLLSIISPTYNESKNVEKLVKLIEISLSKYKYEIIFVDDDSTDKTHEIIKKIHELLKPIGANTISDGGRAADIAPLNDEGVPVLSLKVNNEKYFWYHHTEADTFDKVDFNEFNRCIAAMAIMAYVVADLDQPLPR